MIKTISSVIAATMVVGAVGVGASQAAADTAAGSRSDVAGISTPAETKYSDRAVMQWLLSGGGPIGRDHPETLPFLGIRDGKALKVDPKALRDLTTAYLEYDKSFHKKVSIPMHSGDPIRVDQAFRAFAKTMKAFVAEQTPTTLDATRTAESAQRANGTGAVGFKLYAAMTVAVAANAVVYANVAVATNVAATLVLVWWYLMDDSVDGTSNDFERQHFVMDMTKALKAS